MKKNEEKKKAKKEKQAGVVSRILSYAGKHKPFIYVSFFLSNLSTVALLMLCVILFQLICRVYRSI